MRQEILQKIRFGCNELGSGNLQNTATGNSCPLFLIKVTVDSPMNLFELSDQLLGALVILSERVLKSVKGSY